MERKAGLQRSTLSWLVGVPPSKEATPGCCACGYIQLPRHPGSRWVVMCILKYPSRKHARRKLVLHTPHVSIASKSRPQVWLPDPTAVDGASQPGCSPETDTILSDLHEAKMVHIVTLQIRPRESQATLYSGSCQRARVAWAALTLSLDGTLSPIPIMLHCRFVQALAVNLLIALTVSLEGSDDVQTAVGPKTYVYYGNWYLLNVE